MKNFIIAARPKTLPASIMPPLVSYIYFYSLKQRHEWFYLILCLIGSLAIQMATNFFNDVIDFEKGADTKRVGPLRVSAGGLVDISRVKTWAKMMIGVTLLCGIPIIMRGGVFFLGMGLLSVYLTYGYTGGKVSLAYHGLGELFVFIFFGLFSTIGSYYLYNGSFADTNLSQLIALASIFGILTTTLIMVNNLRDREFDAEVNKRTLATRMSEKLFRANSVTGVFLPYLLLVFFTEYRLLFILALALLPAIKLTLILVKNKGAALNEGLKFAGIHLILFSVLLGVVFINGYSV